MANDLREAAEAVITEALRFADWCAGEGIGPAAGEPCRSPEDFLGDFLAVSGGNDPAAIAEQALAALSPSVGEEGKDGLIWGVFLRDGRFMDKASSDRQTAIEMAEAFYEPGEFEIRSLVSAKAVAESPVGDEDEDGLPLETPEEIDTLAIEACRHFHMDVIPEAFREGLAYRAIVLAIVRDRASRSRLPRRTASAAERDVLAERRRQIAEEGWTPEHDDGHRNGDLAKAGANYAAFASLSDETRAKYPPGTPPLPWRWPDEAWKPKEPRADLVRAAALILAEIERLDRAASGSAPKALDAAALSQTSKIGGGDD